LAAAICAAAPASPRGIFDVYAGNRAEGRPNLITEDFILLGYAMTLDRALADAEEQGLLLDSLRIVEELERALRESSEESEAATGALDYLAVVHALLTGADPSGAGPAAEVKRVREASGIARSDLTMQNLDYSQFRPRGRYTRSPALARYFQGTRFAGTVLFPVVATQATGVSPEEADRLTAEALSLARAFKRSSGLLPRYNGINQRLSVLFGPAEDLTLADLWSVRDAMPPREARSRLLERARHNGHQPAILAAPVDVSKLESGITASDALTGWRLFPLRYTPDSAAMQQLVFDRVKHYRGTGHPESLAMIGGEPVKGFPLAREIMALLGSGEAIRDLDAADERNYEGYAQAFRRAALSLRAGNDVSTRQLRIISEWLQAGGDGNGRQRLGSALGFWTWTRYNNFLYAKQSYTAVLKGVPLIQPRNDAWIEPSPVLYLKLAAQLDALKNAIPGPNLPAMAQVLRQCAELSKAEGRAAGLTAHQIEYLNGLDLELLKLTGRTDRPIVVDVHTEPNSGLVLEEAIAFPGIATRQLANGHVATGARFNHREFKQSIARRLDDDEWLAFLEREELAKTIALRQLPFASGRPRLIRVAAQVPNASGPRNAYPSLLAQGMSLMKQGQWEPARRSFEQAFSHARNEKEAAVAAARTGESLGHLGREREAAEYLQRSLELFHYDQVERELKEMRQRLFAKTPPTSEIQEALTDQLRSIRGTRVLPQRPLLLNIQFDFDKATLTPKGRELVGNLGRALTDPVLRGETVQITGHTDLIGPDDYNQTLSERRAETVANEISRHYSVPRSQIRALGRGKRDPLYPDTNPEDSALNRRVEVMILPGRP
jgi:outer membrane protein OmpA-like peptidoglycan-associated protein